jgi:hypothetical protein
MADTLNSNHKEEHRGCCARACGRHRHLQTGCKGLRREPGKRKGQFTSTVTTWGSTTNEILRLCQFIVSTQATVVVMEATSDYWKPFYYLMEESLPVMLVNAKHARNIPGKKTDVSDATLAGPVGDSWAA